MRMKGDLRLYLAASAAVSVLLAGHGAMAADAAPAAASGTTLEEVVVTSQKRSESLREVPQSVTVVSGRSLEQQQAYRLIDVAAQVPGLNIVQSQPGDSRIVLRGVNTGGVASTVAVYVDETPFGSSSGLVNGAVLAGDFDTFDVSRIEVLRGPQGTLYGASSLGGVLKFVTNAPDFSGFSARGQASIEGVDGGELGWNASGVINQPLGDKAAARVSAYYRKQGGWIDSVGTGGSLHESNVDWNEIYGGRASLLLKPAEPFSLRLTAVLQETKNGAPSIVDADPHTVDPLYGNFTHTAFYPAKSTIKYQVYNATADWDLGFATLTSATSYGRLDQHVVEDLTTLAAGPGLTFGDLFTLFFSTPADPLGAFYPHSLGQKKWTEELRLSSPSGQRFEWLVGGYYTHETGALLQDYKGFHINTLATATLPELGHVTLDSTYEELAGFTNGTFHVTDRLSLALGGRYSHNSQDAHQVTQGLLVGGGATYPPAASSENVFTYSVAPKFDLSDNASIYARIAKGYRPGGPNVLPPGAPANTPQTYKADSLVSYEAGLKADLLERRVSVDLSVFYLDWTDVQLFASINNVGINANGGSAVSKGLEFTVRAKPSAGLSLLASGAVTNAKLTEDTDPIVGGVKGDRLPFSPNWSLTFGADYEHELMNDLTGYAGATLALVGEQNPNFDPDYTAAFGHRLTLDSYARLDLRAGVRNGRWSLEGYIKNATNSRGVSNVQSYGNQYAGALGVSYIRPRTIGATVGASF